ncbi:MAG: sugar phosphate isomerase/epimerase [Verrucomicrobia bacterium]|nr:sugar phosphate isomerase/epimerase [Verrucomicrobiota bacterium]
MKRRDLISRLAVCSWSLKPATPQQLIDQLSAIGLARVQLALDPLREQPQVWSNAAELFARNGITIVSGMIATVGEDYSTPETIRLTGGVVPDQHWDQNWEHIQADAVLAAALGIKLVTFHAGFLPHDERDPALPKLLDRIARIADLFAGKGLTLGFETGQETAETLKIFLQKLNRPNVGVNFDPANMILYDKGDPIEALRVLGPWIRQCHIKDATRTKVPGTWGAEVVVGTGEVDWPSFFATLQEVGFEGDLCIEREAGVQRVADIHAARELAEKVLN